MIKLLLLLTTLTLLSCGGDSGGGSITAPEPSASEDTSSAESTPSAADPASSAQPNTDETEPSPADATAFALMLFRDLETGTIWNLRGEATNGELAGSRLEQLPAYSAFWFAWASFWPDTAVWGQGGSGRLAADTFKAVPVSEYLPDVPKDAIPPLDDEDLGFGHATFDYVFDFLEDDDIVLGVVIGNEVRAYPIKILNWHEIVNHELGGQKLSVTYCPLTASGINFAADNIAFGNTGGLYYNNMVMYDRETESFWAQMKASAILGERAGERLELLPIFQGTWQAWKTLYPETQALNTRTGYSRSYSDDIYIRSGYTTSTEIWFPQTPPIDPRFHPKDMVLGLLGVDTAKAYPFSRLETSTGRRVLNDEFAGEQIVVVHQQSAQMALAFSRRVNGRLLSFELVE